MNSALRLVLLFLIPGFLFPPPAFSHGEHGGAAPLETGFLGERAWLCSIFVLDLESGRIIDQIAGVGPRACDIIFAQ